MFNVCNILILVRIISRSYGLVPFENSSKKFAREHRLTHKAPRDSQWVSKLADICPVGYKNKLEKFVLPFDYSEFPCPFTLPCNNGASDTLRESRLDGTCRRGFETMGGKILPLRESFPARVGEGFLFAQELSQNPAYNPRRMSRFLSTATWKSYADITQDMKPVTTLFSWIGHLLQHDIVGIYKTPQIELTSECKPTDEIFPVSLYDSWDMKWFDSQCIRVPKAILCKNQDHKDYGIPINSVTTWMDLSNIYGPSDRTSDYLRKQGSASIEEYLDVRGNPRLPFDQRNRACVNQRVCRCLSSGTTKGSLDAGQQVTQTMFVHFHNMVVDMFRFSSFSDDQIFEMIREFNILAWQKIIHEEYLPTLMTKDVHEKLATRKPTAEGPTLTKEFAAFGMRQHQHIQSDLQIRTDDGTLCKTFKIWETFNDSEIYLRHGSRTILRGALNQPLLKDDEIISDGITQFHNVANHERLKNSYTDDLITIDIQRGRELGLLPYGDYQKYAAEVLQEIGISHPGIASAFEKPQTLGSSLHKMDAFVGVLSEVPVVPGALIGGTQAVFLMEGFGNMVASDPFSYQKVMAVKGDAAYEFIGALNHVTLRTVVCAFMITSGRTEYVQTNPLLLYDETQNPVPTKMDNKSPDCLETCCEELFRFQTKFNVPPAYLSWCLQEKPWERSDFLCSSKSS